MQISSLFFQIAFLVLPGIIGRNIYRKLVGEKNKKEWEDFTEILIFSLFSYVILGFFYSIQISKDGVNFCYEVVPTLDALNNVSSNSGNNQLIKSSINWGDIFWGSAIGCVLGFIATFFNTHKVLNHFGNWLKVTNRFGDDDLWDLFHGTSEINWVIIRDHKEDLVYYCYVDYFSDLGNERELILREVDVYSNVGEGELDILYSLDTLYISRDKYDLSIEIWNEKEDDESEDNSEEEVSENV